jgi:hypothetical protein
MQKITVGFIKLINCFVLCKIVLKVFVTPLQLHRHFDNTVQGEENFRLSAKVANSSCSHSRRKRARCTIWIKVNSIITLPLVIPIYIKTTVYQLFSVPAFLGFNKKKFNIIQALLEDSSFLQYLNWFCLDCFEFVSNTLILAFLTCIDTLKPAKKSW